MTTRDPFTVEYFIGRSAFPPYGAKWVEVLDVPNADVTDARLWLKAQGYQWTTRRRWRIVDRQGAVIQAFEPTFIEGSGV